MDTHSFTLFLRGADVLDDEALERLFEAGCDDATFGAIHGAQYATFHREETSFPRAVLTSIDAVERAVEGVLVVGISGFDLETASEIAERIGRTRESVRLLIEGKRGPGGFPPPVPWVSAGKARLYEWPDVARWLSEHGHERPTDTKHTDFIAALNGALAVRYRADRLNEPDEREAVAQLIDRDKELLAGRSPAPHSCCDNPGRRSSALPTSLGGALLL